MNGKRNCTLAVTQQSLIRQGQRAVVQPQRSINPCAPSLASYLSGLTAIVRPPAWRRKKLSGASAAAVRQVKILSFV